MHNFKGCRLGLIGCGRWGKFILRDLVDLGCEVSVVASDGPSHDNATEYGATSIVPTVAELADELEGFVIATPTATHYEVIASIAGRGRPIYCEKPLTNDVEKAQSIVNHWGDLVFVMDKWRYHPAIEQMRSWVESGKFGRLESIRTRRLQWGSPHTDVGAPWILLPHDLSIVRHILGELPELEWCCGQVSGGETISVSALLNGQVSCFLEASIASPVTHRRVEIYGEKGGVVLEDSDYGHLLWNHQDDWSFARPPEKFKLSEALPLRAELEAFVDYVHCQGEPPLTSAAEGLESVAYISRMIDMVQCRSLP